MYNPTINLKSIHDNTNTGKIFAQDKPTIGLRTCTGVRAGLSSTDLAPDAHAIKIFVIMPGMMEGTASETTTTPTQ